MTRSIDDLDLPVKGSRSPDLAGRLERLADGHPSSPRNADGSPRPPVTVPRGTELPSEADQPDRKRPPADSQPSAEPFTDSQWTDHVRDVADRLEQAHEAGLATDERYTVEPDREVWASERRALHTEIIEHLYKKAMHVPNEHRAIIAGGLPGAGKTTVLEQRAGIDRSQFLTINPDNVKEEMARRGLIPNVPGLSPMEASDLVHEESSHVAKRLARRAEAEGKNVIWDITMSSLESTQARIQDLREHGYTSIEGVFVDLPPEVSATRADSRHRDGQEKHRAGNGDGGRFIPVDVIMANSDPDWGSVNRRTFEAVKPALDGWSLYDNSVEGRAAILIDRWPQGERNR